jgi:polysaccharide deacetylase 2 family uncharacterized protein YibQ
VAADDLDAPLGKSKKRKGLTLPVALPQIVAGVLGLTIAAAGVWTVMANDPYGGEPVVVVATSMGSEAKATDQSVAAAARAAITPVPKVAATEAAAPPPGSKIITITDGSNGKSQQVVVPPRGDAKADVRPDTKPDKKAALDPQLLEESRHGNLPKIAPDGRRPALAYAMPVNVPAGKTDAPRIAVIVGGLGISASATAEALEKLPGPVTLAYAPYSTNLDAAAANARARNHEVLLQAPMEPFDYPDNDPGPQTLLTSLSAAQNIDRLQWLMARMQGYVGIASLMGARFTASDQALSPVLKEIARRGLIYVDDGSSARSVASQIAGAQNLPFAKADIVLDALPTPVEIDHALARLELAARERGSAVGYATASPASVARIADWAKNVTSRGFVLVPISAVVVKAKSS